MIRKLLFWFFIIGFVSVHLMVIFNHLDKSKNKYEKCIKENPLSEDYCRQISSYYEPEINLFEKN